MHASVMEYVREVVRELKIAGADVIEVGSYDVNGSVRGLFELPIVGVDMRDGPGVDFVANGHELPFDDERFDVAISTETLEHDPQPWRTVSEMARVASRFVILTARGFDQRGCFPLHDYPDDVYRFSRPAMRGLLEWAGLEVVDLRLDPQDPGVFAAARKP